MSYDAIAEGYDRFVRESTIHRVVMPAVLDLCGPGRRILDLACGQGVLTRALAGTGRTVVGVDASEQLIHIARAEEERQPLGIRYVEDDARSLDHVDDCSFDGVTCSLALTDIDELAGVLAAVGRVLKPGGWLVLATLHPCFGTAHIAVVELNGNPGVHVSRYFEEGRWWSANPDRLLAPIGWHHRTLSTVLNLLLEAGFVLDRFEEPRGRDPVTGQLLYLHVAEVLAIRAGFRPGSRGALHSEA
jgi:ubiquinone/menaquinone biosynthesis C-methylase UbiE